ncbi:MAG: hypothetical protein CMD33_01380 [Flavobacteriales bacterium]|mgnify:CR=1 FL=1|nr:hypothetical protein [Flavobacteriales bacterium]
MQKKETTFIILILGVLGCPTVGAGQINTYSINDTVTEASGPFTLNVDGDLSNDCTFEIFPLSGSSTAARVVSLWDSYVMDASTFGYPDALNCGDLVTGPYTSGNAVLGTDVGGGGSFTGAGLKFLGLKMDVGSESYRGWVSLEVAASNDTIILHEVGYSTAPNYEITAGQMSDESDAPLCGFIYTVGTQYEIEVAAPTTGNGLPLMAPVFISTFAGDVILAEDSCFAGPCTHLVSNAMGADTIITCIDYLVYGATMCVMDTPTCCVTQAWDEESQSWQIAETASGIAVEPAHDVVLYPVPTSGQLNIRGQFDDLRIFDVFGRLVLTAGRASVVDVSGLTAGDYFVEITSSTGRWTEKIQVVR